jgi:hypothetical protein
VIFVNTARRDASALISKGPAAPRKAFFGLGEGNECDSPDKDAGPRTYEYAPPVHSRALLAAEIVPVDVELAGAALLALSR